MELPLTQKDLECLEEKQKQKIEKENNTIVIKCEKNLNEYFIKSELKQQRNSAIITAYLDGYQQVEISNYLNISKSLVSKVIKSGDSTPGV